MRRLFAIEGLACGGCARGLERHLSRLPAVRSVGVHHLTASALVDWDETRLSVEGIGRAVAVAGYRLIERHHAEELASRLDADIRRLSLRLAVAVMAGMWSMALSIVLYVSAVDEATGWWIALGAGGLALPVLWAGRGIFWMAARSLRLRTPGMDLLIAVGSLGAVTISIAALVHGSSHVYFDTATMLVTLLLVGRLLDAITRRSTIEALTALQSSTPETAMLVTGGATTETPLAMIARGARVRVDAGDAISVDGIVVSGTSAVDRSVLTGESMPIPVCAGARVEAGAVNLERRMFVEVDRDHGDRDIDRMGGAIALEIARRGTLANAADRIAGQLSWEIPGLALSILIVTPIFGVSMIDAALRALAILAGACPCALSLAAPLVQARAAGIAAARGIRIREPNAFETLARVRTAIFDKTGTLTEGRPRVTGVLPEPGWTSDEVLGLAARAETGILHPLAQAIVARHGSEIGEGGLRQPRGAVAQDESGRVISVVGSSTDAGLTRLIVALDGKPIGALDLADQLRPDAAGLLASLGRDGVSIQIATGDSQGPARAVGAKLGLDEADIHFACTAQDKAVLVARSKGPVLFVGDGVNDAPALASAGCGISVAEAHSAAAQTADVAILHGGIEQVVTAISIARRSVRIGRQNIGLALVYNALIVPFALTGHLSPTMAALAMLASSLSVSLNSLRLAGPTRLATDPSAVVSNREPA
ncbi:heavy metal translocating P-type ATPase [Roseibium aggregatum]|uniref:Cation-translocating P-type ATPase n=1 Tax=Roseibium aggregatum TaxID=187304 RepID=A0A939IZN9_9HYPH|nr:cation-translocating P-type ATPase [Roseibium aggregatum]MBN9670241.1 cation-translocating P-type ATPase [Roseibium aggregatum]